MGPRPSATQRQSFPLPQISLRQDDTHGWQLTRANDAARLEMYQKANQYHMQLWSEALQKMAATDEGERSLLDNSMILFCSSLWDGNAHDSKQLPILLAGGGGGTIKGGRMIDYSQDENRKLCRLHMAVMERMGVKTQHFGDAENPLSDLA